MKLSSNVKGMYLIVCGIGICLSWSIETVAFSGLSKGFTRAENITPFRAINTEFGYRPAYLVNVGIPDTYYGLSRDGSGVAYYDLANKTAPKGWSLARTTDDSQDAIRELSRANSVGSDETSENSFLMGTEHDALGGLWDPPLRYGDVLIW